MNHFYRLCWNAATSQWVAASELARRSRPTSGGARQPRGGHSPLRLTALALALGLGLSGWAHAGQTGGQVVAGSGSIAQDGAVTTITQTSQQLSLNWQSFNIDAGETVNFIQPGASSIAVNRVLGNSASEIFGNLNANGQVWLINPNGVLFGKNAQVDVGGIVASTLDTSDTSLFSATRRFNGDGHGSVVNRGRITDAIVNGALAAATGLPALNPLTDRAMLCGSPGMLGDMAALLDGRGFHVSPRTREPGDYVLERAFVES